MQLGKADKEEAASSSSTNISLVLPSSQQSQKKR
jgi:hypothetical protein